MTYARLKSAIKLLLIGDNDIPLDADGNIDNDQMAAALEMAYIELASKATALKLLTRDLDLYSIIVPGYFFKFWGYSNGPTILEYVYINYIYYFIYFILYL